MKNSMLAIKGELKENLKTTICSKTKVQKLLKSQEKKFFVINI
jgi:hypothetical protein